MKIKVLMAVMAAVSVICGAAPKPNILFIHIDDMDFDEIGAYAGTGQCWTPHMDELVKSGMKFTRGYVTSPVCVPSRFATLTGRYASRCAYNEHSVSAETTLNIENVWGEGGNARKTPPVIEENEYTFAKLLKRAGYTTGLVGKIHNDRPSLQRPVQGMVEGDSHDPVVAEKIRQHYRTVVDRVRRNFGFDVVDRLYYDNKEQLPIPKDLQTINGAWITEGAIRFLEDVDKSKPFCLYYSNPIPHGQMVRPLGNKNNAGKKIIGHHVEINMAGEKALATPAGWLAEPPATQPSVEDCLERFWASAPNANPDAALLTWLDDSVGALLGKLDELGLRDNTLIFFLSDHQSVDKFTVFETGAHVPFAVSWKGHVAPKTVSDSLVCSLDITATMVDVAGVDIPEDCVLDGFSMVPMFGNPDAEIRDDFLIELGYGRGLVTRSWQYLALRFPEDMEQPSKEKPQLPAGGDRKGKAQRLLENHPGGMDFDQLYRLDRDPGLVSNVWKNPENKAVGEKLRGRLGEYIKTFPHAFGEF